ncbi:MAG: L-threonylcarbamoyladenylate synthase [Hyphomonadaceae bacterium]|nr:L-threonylcarbamoyladenylate synthase [Hyphomonadaceae bacterium]
MRADAESIAEAAAILARGGLVAMPTETVYGLAADATNPKAVARLYAAKGRPHFNPLIAHVRDAHAARACGDFSAAADALAAAFWPGPLTLVVPRRGDGVVCDLACAGLDTIALRAPDHAVAQDLLAALGKPIVAPSANLSGRVSATRAEHVAADFADAVDLILDAGPSAHGLESTIIGCTGAAPALLRPGAIPRAAIEAIVGALAAAGAGVSAPGQLASHYAPRARLRLDADAPRAGEAYLGFGAFAAPGAPNLSARGDAAEAAANLYAMLRALDAEGPAAIAVAPIPAEGLGEAIRDRLTRASAPRDAS